jgi:hypothetical protein
MQQTPDPTPAPPKLSEDWLAVILAFLLIALAAAGILGKVIPIVF